MKKRITFHVRNKQSTHAHNFASAAKAIEFGRALSTFCGPGLTTFVVAQERDDDGAPVAHPDVIWARASS